MVFTEKDPNSLTLAFTFINQIGKRKNWKLKFASVPEYTEWNKALCISRRPIWDPESVLKCVECDRNFTFFRRQHHCRNCGRVVCGDHSENRFLLEDLAYDEPVRVCDTCTKKLS